MGSIAAGPALALVAGAACGIASTLGPRTAAALMAAAVCLSLAAWLRGLARAMLAAGIVAFAAAGVALGADARDRALHTSLRAALDEAFGGFTLAHPGPEGRHDPVPVRAVLTEDAAPRDDYVSLQARVRAIHLGGRWHEVGGGVSLSVSGDRWVDRVDDWRSGRTIEAPVTFRRATRYLNDGVPDHERTLALDGTTLLGSTKSGLLVHVLDRGTLAEEAAATVRAHVRRGAGRWIAPHSPLSGAIVVAILIGDRTGLPSEIRERLQAAGTYHVIAISGGNIAILAGLVVGMLMLAGAQGRRPALVVILVLACYAQVVTAEPSVWRATVMGILYFAARAMDHRTAPWHAIAVTAAFMAVLDPLGVRGPGFILSFGATLALLEGARRGRTLLPARRGLAWVAASIAASAATEAALLPVAAAVFSRVTLAGLVLNLLAVPLMTVIQAAGMTAVLAQPLDWVAAPAGWVAHAAAVLLVESARLVEVAPWLTARVPAPHPAVVVTYYVALALLLYGRRPPVRAAGAGLLLAAVAAIAGAGPSRSGGHDGNQLRVTLFDVGQAEAILIEPPRGPAFLVDTGGTPFGAGFDVGGRVLAPALWARGIRSLDALLITHADPDHIGGAQAVVRDFRPRHLWQGVPVPGDPATTALESAAARAGVRLARRLAGDWWTTGGVVVRVLHPPAPDWERRQVRNDDSIVLEVVFRDVALLLAGDIGAEIERSLLPRLTPAPRRVLKVAHHGSRNSSSMALLEGWRPQIALVSAGRGNTFGHPAPEVLHRLDATGAEVFRTDLHGQITLVTDGVAVGVTTRVGAEGELLLVQMR